MPATRGCVTDAVTHVHTLACMNPAVVSLLALVVAIILSMTSGINVGVVAIALAWLIGTSVAHLGADTIIRGFPVSLFLTLAGISLLFAMAETNGTLGRLADGAVRLARGDARRLPPIFFAIACLVSAVGPGAVPSVALVAPAAMVIAGRAGVPYFLMALMVTNGANAGSLSPISAVGVIVNTKMAAAGLPDHAGLVWFANFAASAMVALVAYAMLSGYRLRGGAAGVDAAPARETMSAGQRLTIVVLVAWIGGVLLLNLNVGLSAFAAVLALVVCRVAEDAAAIKRVPWGVIVMVCGVTVLIALLETTGGMALFTDLLSRLSTPRTVNGVMAFVTGAISFYSSTSGVVLPTFLPTVPGMIQRLGGGDPLALSLSINIGSSLVDVSPLSTLGALCVAAVPDGPSATVLFRRLMLWGLSMAVVGAVLCQLLAGTLARL